MSDPTSAERAQRRAERAGRAISDARASLAYAKNLLDVTPDARAMLAGEPVLVWLQGLAVDLKRVSDHLAPEACPVGAYVLPEADPVPALCPGRAECARCEESKPCSDHDHAAVRA